MAPVRARRPLLPVRLVLRTAATITTIAACQAEPATAPARTSQSATAQLHPMAFTADVNVRTRAVVITPPAMQGAGAPTLSIGGADRPALSLLGGDVIRLIISNYRVSAVGAFTPGKIRVTFDVAIDNRLPSLRLITPTWPVPPASGVILFPIDYAVTYAPGGVVGGDGNTVLVEQPQFGAVTPSVDFDGTGAPGSGAPYSFFNDAVCTSSISSDCFRWEAFGPQLEPLSSAVRRTIGFDIDPSVAQFRARMIVAADLAPAN